MGIKAALNRCYSTNGCSISGRNFLLLINSSGLVIFMVKYVLITCWNLCEVDMKTCKHISCIVYHKHST